LPRGHINRPKPAIGRSYISYPRGDNRASKHRFIGFELPPQYPLFSVDAIDVSVRGTHYNGILPHGWRRIYLSSGLELLRSSPRVLVKGEHRPLRISCNQRDRKSTRLNSSHVKIS